MEGINKINQQHGAEIEHEEKIKKDRRKIKYAKAKRSEARKQKKQERIREKGNEDK